MGGAIVVGDDDINHCVYAFERYNV
jgi:hypothetical protein